MFVYRRDTERKVNNFSNLIFLLLQSFILMSCLVLSANISSSQSRSLSSSPGGKELPEGLSPMINSPITRIKMRSNGRTNSRFLRTFPPLEFLNFARRDGHLTSDSPESFSPNQNTLIGNSPVFYIRLPPAPYVLVPGLGYVSPHPYNSPVMGMGIPPSPGKIISSKIV